MSALWQLGFEAIAPASNRWKRAYLYQLEKQTMVILVRSRGVDALVTDSEMESMVNSEGYLSVTSRNPTDKFVEYFYTESSVDIHDYIYAAAEAFVQGGNTTPDFYKGDGISGREWAMKHGKLSKSANMGLFPI